jgi:hypothetical protein
MKSSKDSNLTGPVENPEPSDAALSPTSSDELRKGPSLSERDKTTLYRALWVVAGAATVFLGLRQYMYFKGVVPGTIIGEGGDFYSFLTAAREILAGHTPYSVASVHKGYGYVYSPFLALVLIPVCHLSVKLLWRSWTILSLAALVVGGGLIAKHGSPHLRRWHRPVFFAFVAFTALDFGPTKWELYNGQTDAFVLLLLIVSSLAAQRNRPALSGFLIGTSAVLKSWPGAVALTIVRRGQRRRARAIVAFVVTALLAPALVLLFEGASGLMTFVKVTFAGSSQPDPSYSVWGTPKVVFSATRLARPLVISVPLRDLSTLVLVAIVLGLLWLVIRSSSSLLSYWNVVAGVVLLLPVSHLAYTLYFLPILWIWTLRALATPSDRTSLFMTVVMLGWWAFMYRWGWVEWPSEGALHYMYPFFADFAAFAASALADYRRHVRASPAHRDHDAVALAGL